MELALPAHPNSKEFSQQFHLMKLSHFKKLFILLFCAQTITGFSKESMPVWYVASSKKDSALGKNQSAFSFHFAEAYSGRNIESPVKMSCNGVNYEARKDENGTYVLKVKPGKHLFRFYHNENFYEITTDSINIKPGFISVLIVSFHSSKHPVICEKPVIYVYPGKKTDIKIELNLNGSLNFTYPRYKNGWQFSADSSGTILMSDKKYNYLFWDGQINPEWKRHKMNEGFIVCKENLVSFFEQKLSQMGLTDKEAEDFITYWCPQMMAYENTFIHFLFNDEFDAYAHMKVDPKPDEIFRVFMTWKKAEHYECGEVKPQEIKKCSRKGFTIVEWGGGKIEEDLK
jgi:hypothetical protein